MPRQADAAPEAVRALLERSLGTALPLSFERTPEGVSTPVYRVRRGGETLYLRLAETPDDDLTTEAGIHRRLLGIGVRVPEIVDVVRFDAALGRSAMLTREIPGRPLSDGAPPEVETVLEAAGRDVARLNLIEVEGFSWIRRDGRPLPPRGEEPDYAAFVRWEVPEPWPGPLAGVVAPHDLDIYEEMIESESRRPLTAGRLAHGDFDVTHVFQRGGRYTGLIDLGELRGTEPLFDLGVFHLYDGEILERPLLSFVLRGYGQILPLPDGHAELIRRSAILYGLRQLCRWLGPRRNISPDAPLIKRRVRRLRKLLDAGPQLRSAK